MHVCVCMYLYHRDQVLRAAPDPSGPALESPQPRCTDLHSSLIGPRYCVMWPELIHGRVPVKGAWRQELSDTLFRPPQSDLDR
jgi:hypothetical protein